MVLFLGCPRGDGRGLMILGEGGGGMNMICELGEVMVAIGAMKTWMN
jgi:hypothetical protein